MPAAFYQGACQQSGTLLLLSITFVTHLHHKYACYPNHLLAVPDVLDECGDWRKN